MAYVTFDVETTWTSAMIWCVCGNQFRASGEPAKVKRLQREWEEKHAHCTKQPYVAKTFWLSFCDGQRPKGQQFLGACIVDVMPEEVEDAYLDVLLRFPFAQKDAEYIAAATRKAHALGCNPGGEMAACDVTDHPNLAYFERGVLMDRATIERIDKNIATEL